MQKIGIRLFLNKFDHPTNSQFAVKQIGILAGMIMSNKNNKQRERKKSPIFLTIYKFYDSHYYFLKLAYNSLNKTTKSFIQSPFGLSNSLK